MSLSGIGKRYSATGGRNRKKKKKKKKKNNNNNNNNNKKKKSEINFSGKQRLKKLLDTNKILTKKTITDKTKPKKLEK